MPSYQMHQGEREKPGREDDIRNTRARMRPASPTKTVADQRQGWRILYHKNLLIAVANVDTISSMLSAPMVPAHDASHASVTIATPPTRPSSP